VLATPLREADSVVGVVLTMEKPDSRERPKPVARPETNHRQAHR
jgi:hypothetical protein